MIVQESFLRSLKPLKQYLTSENPELDNAIHHAHAMNQWFIPDFSRRSINAIAEQFLDENKCREWLAKYPGSKDAQKKVAIVMAGNVPLVGFHDLMCVLAAGHHALIKLSDKDSLLTKFITDEWIRIEPSLASRISYVDRLENFDAVIATGSNNSSRYFEYYFKNHPHILRRNRNGVAILTGKETKEQLKELAKDIFLYFGLGCRNVSKMYVPEGYDFSDWDSVVEDWKSLSDHNKYRNNLDYNYAIYIINQVPHIQLGHLILKEDEAIASRIGCVHFTYYASQSDLSAELELKRNEIQCLISVDPIHGWEHVRPGQSQYPSLDQYADGVDTMEFLARLALTNHSSTSTH